VPLSNLESLKIKAKLLQKSKARLGRDIPLKDALALIAQSAGYASWRELKSVYEATELYSPQGSAYWHTWYASYSEARKHLEETPNNYLLPFQKQFFICDANYIASLGISTQDADLQNVGPNWVEPRNMAAMKRLEARIRRARHAASR